MRLGRRPAARARNSRTEKNRSFSIGPYARITSGRRSCAMLRLAPSAVSYRAAFVIPAVFRGPRIGPTVKEMNPSLRSRRTSAGGRRISLANASTPVNVSRDRGIAPGSAPGRNPGSSPARMSIGVRSTLDAVAALDLVPAAALSALSAESPQALAASARPASRPATACLDVVEAVMVAMVRDRRGGRHGFAGAKPMASR